jgi:hypothetical protein
MAFSVAILFILKKININQWQHTNASWAYVQQHQFYSYKTITYNFLCEPLGPILGEVLAVYISELLWSGHCPVLGMKNSKTRVIARSSRRPPIAATRAGRVEPYEPLPIGPV